MGQGGGLDLLPQGQTAPRAGTCDASDHTANLALWDTLLHPRRARVFGVRLFDEDNLLVGPIGRGSSLFAGSSGAQSTSSNAAECTALRHCEDRSTLLVGTRKGLLTCVDTRKMSGSTLSSSRQCVVSSFQAHSQSVRSLVTDPSERVCVSGSQNGEVKIWSLPNFSLLAQITLRQANEYTPASSAVTLVVPSPGEADFQSGEFPFFIVLRFDLYSPVFGIESVKRTITKS